jgi:hypothetical protein
MIDDIFDRLSQAITSLGADGRHMNRVDEYQHHGNVGLGDDPAQDRRMGMSEQFLARKGLAGSDVEIALDQPI